MDFNHNIIKLTTSNNLKVLILLLYLILFIVTFSIPLISQPSFENKTRVYKKNLPTRSVIPGGIMDLDGDLIDDIVILDKGIWLKPMISNGKYFGLSIIDSSRVAQNSEITLAAGDLNNDGTPEIITSGEYSLINVSTIKNNKITKKAFQSGIYAQGSNTVDINNDGWLDYFLANDDGPSRIYINDKSGNLILTPIIDFMIGDTTDGSGNYGSIWTDVNGDYRPDLCISKCRAYITEADDPRRINRLYINLGNGIFHEKGEEFGLNNGEQSWVTAFGDLDNDGDQDAFLINHYAPHILYENISNQKFIPVTKNAPISSFGFQVAMMDLDNDGLLDIITAGVDGTIILHNQGNFNFKVIKDAIGPNLPRSMTIGDLNDDGFPDIYAHINEPINLVGLKDDELWLNNGNQNKYLKINLEGNISNKSAIGAHLSLYTPSGRQIRTIKGGESYGVVNSFQQIFGLGASDKIDSLVIRWPSGKFESFKQLKANTTYYIQEGKCSTEQVALYQDEVIWKGSPISLASTPGFQSYLWNDGSVSSKLETNAPGKYFVKMTDNKGCVTISKPINVISGCFTQNVKLINESREVKICKASNIEISSMKADKYKWSNGSTNQSIIVNTSQIVTILATDYCNVVKSDTISIKVVEFNWALKGDSIKKGNTATLRSSLPSTLWFEYPDLINPVFTGPEFKTAILDSTVKYFAKATEIIDFKSKNVGATSFPPADMYGANSIAGGLVFNVERNCTIKSVSVMTDTKGKRKIIISNKDGNILFSKEVMIDIGVSRVPIDVALKPGIQYRMFTDETTNTKELGFASPRLVRTFNNTQYPYVIDNVLSINASTFGAIYYYYFYDWEVHYDHVICESDIREVIAFVDKSSSLSKDSKNTFSFKVSPSPAHDYIYLNFSAIPLISKITITDIHSQNLKTLPGNVSRIDISNLPPGIFFINVFMDDNRHVTQKFIKL